MVKSKHACFSDVLYYQRAIEERQVNPFNTVGLENLIKDCESLIENVRVLLKEAIKEEKKC